MRKAKDPLFNVEKIIKGQVNRYFQNMRVEKMENLLNRKAPKLQSAMAKYHKALQLFFEAELALTKHSKKHLPAITQGGGQQMSKAIKWE